MIRAHQGALPPVTPVFDAPAEGQEAAAADLSIPIVGVDNSDRGRFKKPGVARGLPSPNEPTDEERAEHNLTHWPFRIWCPYCVAGKRHNSPHCRVPTPRKIPLLSADYGFVSDPGEPLVTILVLTMAPFCVFFFCNCC